MPQRLAQIGADCCPWSPRKCLALGLESPHGRACHVRDSVREGDTSPIGLQSEIQEITEEKPS